LLNVKQTKGIIQKLFALKNVKNIIKFWKIG